MGFSCQPEIEDQLVSIGEIKTSLIIIGVDVVRFQAVKSLGGA